MGFEMAGYQGPIDIPLIGESVSNAVRAFADERGFEFAARYHDEPIWFVRKGDGSGFFQQVQLAAFVTPEGPLSLFFVPFAYVVENNQNVRVTPPNAFSVTGAAPTPQTRGDRISVAELMQLNPDDAVRRIQDKLTVTWQQVSLFHRQQAVSRPPLE